jgi:TfoX/Sxy family transcriptional regulator of competence genes
MSELGTEELLEIFHSVLPEGAEERLMGGSPAALVNGNVFMRVRRSQFVLRLPSAHAKQLLQEPGATVFEPIPGRPMQEYVVVPEAVLQVPFELGVWVKRSYDYAARLATQASSQVPKAAPRTQSAKTVQIRARED